MAYAAALFADACLRGLNGATATECTYVDSSVDPDLPFLATKVKLGTDGGFHRQGLWHQLPHHSPGPQRLRPCWHIHSAVPCRAIID